MLTAAAACFFVKVLADRTRIRLAHTLTRMWVIFIRNRACWSGTTLASTCVVVEVLSITTCSSFLALAFARCAIEILVLGAGQLLLALAATTGGVKILIRMAFLRLANTLAFIWVVIIWSITCWWISAPTLTCVVVIKLVWPAQLDYLASTLARSCVKVLVISAGQIFMALTAAGVIVKVLIRVANLGSAGTIAGGRIKVV